MGKHHKLAQKDPLCMLQIILPYQVPMIVWSSASLVDHHCFKLWT